MSDTIDTLIDAVIGREGGYSNNPADRGGATNWGITQAVARANGYAGDMRTLPRATAAAIYRHMYFDAPGFNLILSLSSKVAAELFDTGVNMGPQVAGQFLQRALNVLNRGAADFPDLVADGRVGKMTAAALATFLRLRGAAGEATLLKALNALQGARYVELAEQRPANEAFEFGWLTQRVGALA